MYSWDNTSLHNFWLVSQRKGIIEFNRIVSIHFGKTLNYFCFMDRRDVCLRYLGTLWIFGAREGHIFIDREAREIMYLIAFVRLSVRLSPLSRLNRLTNKSHCQSKVLVCVSIISWHMRIIARMRSIGF